MAHRGTDFKGFISHEVVNERIASLKEIQQQLPQLITAYVKKSLKKEYPGLDYDGLKEKFPSLLHRIEQESIIKYQNKIESNLRKLQILSEGLH